MKSLCNFYRDVEYLSNQNISDVQSIAAAYLDIARRLKEAQQKIAEAKAEALEEARDSIMMDMSTKMCKDPLDIVSYLREQSAEYRANAKGDKP